MKLIGLVNLIIFFHLAPSRMIYDNCFSRYDFLKINLRKIEIEFFWFFIISSRNNKKVYLCLIEHANTKKKRMFMSIAAHL